MIKTTLSVFAITLHTSASATEVEAMLNAQDAVNFIGGFLEGFTGNNYIEDLETCTDLVDVTQDVLTALSDFDSGNAAQAIQEFFDLIKNVDESLNECAEAIGDAQSQFLDDIQELDDWVMIFDDPIRLTQIIANRLLLNIEEIDQKVEQIENNLGIAAYEAAGVALSELITMTIGPADSDEFPEETSCWRDAYYRDWRFIQDCPANQENDAGLCYDLCQKGYDGAGPVCWQDCPSGSADYGAFCEELESGDCPANMTSYWWDMCAKDTYWRGFGSLPTCADDEEQDGIFCRTPCTDGFDGFGPICLDICPAGKTPCGYLCLDDGQTCSDYISEGAQFALSAITNFTTNDITGGFIDVANIASNLAFQNCEVY